MYLSACPSATNPAVRQQMKLFLLHSMLGNIVCTLPTRLVEIIYGGSTPYTIGGQNALEKVFTTWQCLSFASSSDEEGTGPVGFDRRRVWIKGRIRIVDDIRTRLIAPGLYAASNPSAHALWNE